MLTIYEVKTRKQRRDFVNIVDKIYKGNPYYVPTLKIDDHAMFDTKKNVLLKTCKWMPLICYRDGKPVARIIGLIQNLEYEKTNQMSARFFYFDAFDDFEAVKLTFDTLIDWAKKEGAVNLKGPLGFNDTSREGMLIDGFDSIGTFETLYNHPYYITLMEQLGFKKDVDWIQYRVEFPDINDPRIERMERIAELCQKRYKLSIVKPKNKKELLENYGKRVFELLNTTYAPLYGVVHLTDEVIDSILKSFGLVIKNELIRLVEDENHTLVGFLICFSNFSKAVNKSKGRLFPFGIFRLLRALNTYTTVDLALIGVLPEYQSRGVNAIMISDICKFFAEKNVRYMETNLVLEDNNKSLSQWRELDKEQHKKNRSWIINI